MSSDTIAVLDRWHSAVDAVDVEAVAALCSEEVAVTGPRGVGRGRDLVRAWPVRSASGSPPGVRAKTASHRLVARRK